MDESLIKKGKDGTDDQIPARIVLFVLCGVAFTSNVNISIIAPFLPQHFESIGLEQLWCGVMFSGFPVAMLLFSPLAVLAMSIVGRVPVLFVGLLLQGFFSISFGYCDDMTGGPGVNPHGALVCYGSSRLLCGLGGAFANNAIFTIAADRFPKTLGKVMGLNEVVIGVGFSLGPPIGTVLYLWGDFSTPFVVAGATIFIIAPFALMLWRPRAAVSNADTQEDEGVCTFRSVLSKGLLASGIILLFGTGVFGIVEPILSLYLEKQVGVSQDKIGLIFAIFAVAYSVAGPLMGGAADKYGAMKISAAGGLAAGLVMCCLMGPVASLIQPGTLLRVLYEVFALILLGVAQAATLIPSLPAMKSYSGSRHKNATAMVTCWFNIFLQLGLAIAPPIGTVMVDRFGFELTLLFVGALFAAYNLLALNFAVTTPPYVEPDEGERMPRMLSPGDESIVRLRALSP